MAADHRTRGDSRAGFTAHALGDVFESVYAHSKAFSENGENSYRCAFANCKRTVLVKWRQMVRIF